MSKVVDVKEFARRVERMCDYFLSRASEEAGRTGSPDVEVIEKLKEEAADIQLGIRVTTETLEGLSDYMKGAPNELRPSGDQPKDRP